jgi:hypothetical protein
MRIACKIEKTAVIERIILNPIGEGAASNISSITITINTPIIEQFP